MKTRIFANATFRRIAVMIPASLAPLAVADDAPKVGEIVQFGKMHEVIGMQRHEGRVGFRRLVERPHFYGVAAMEGLQGEATIHDGQVTITSVDASGKLLPREQATSDQQATLLIGAYVPSWTTHDVAKDVPGDDFDAYVEKTAAAAGVSTDKPFLFIVKGEFRNVRLHVIHGACPIHARIRKIELPAERKPYETELKSISGTVVGVFAKDAVGRITHPATSCHAHLLFKDPATGKMVTGHIEQLGVHKGASLKLPQVAEPR